jgi:hypothetical protein
MMIEYITALVLDYDVQGEYARSVIYFDTEAQCEQAIRAVDPLYAVIRQYKEDPSMHCVRTDVMSKPPEPPMPRPERG